ncbi:5-formyltetrahydrofolate cyclo-ligase [Silvimonas sp. JCM 19000]
MPDPQALTDKAALRRTLRQRRVAIDDATRRTASLAVMRQIRSAGLLRRGRNIAIYVPMGSELSTWPLILAALKAGCRVFLPETPRPGKGRHLEFVRFDEASRWHQGAYGIPVPVHTHYCAPRDLDLVFLPLLGFDAVLGRMGQGGGYYDTTFAFRRARRHWKKPQLIGVAFDCQRVDALPLDPWDLRLDKIFTETGHYNSRLSPAQLSPITPEDRPHQK